jgi:hypothetical protein
MTPRQLLLRVAGVLGAVILIERIVADIYSYVVQIVGNATFPAVSSGGGDVEQVLPFLPGILFSAFIFAFGFAAGAYVSLRFLRPVTAEISWGSLLGRGVFAAFIGATVILLIHVTISLLYALKIGPYPFAYAFTTSFVPHDFVLGLLDTLGEGLSPFLEYVPLAILACVFLKLWLSGHWRPVRGVLSESSR